MTLHLRSMHGCRARYHSSQSCTADRGILPTVAGHHGAQSTPHKGLKKLRAHSKFSVLEWLARRLPIPTSCQPSMLAHQALAGAQSTRGRTRREDVRLACGQIYALMAVDLPPGVVRANKPMRVRLLDWVLEAQNQCLTRDSLSGTRHGPHCKDEAALQTFL